MASTPLFGPVTYTTDLHALVRQSRRRIAALRRFRENLAGTIVACGLGAYLAARGNGFALLLCVPAPAYVLWAWRMPRRIYARLAQDGSLLLPRSLTVFTYGIVVETDHLRSILKWAGLSGAAERSDAVSLLRGRREVLRIPASAFSPEHDVAQFLALVRSRACYEKAGLIGAAELPAP